MFKLLKHYFKGMYKIHLYVMGVVLISGLTGLGLDFLAERVKGDGYLVLMVAKQLLTGVFFISLGALFFITIFLSIKLFHNKVLSDQGYLTNTLPIKTNSILNAIVVNNIIFILFDAIFAVGILYLFNGKEVNNITTEMSLFSRFLFILLMFFGIMLFTFYVKTALAIGYSKNDKIKSSILVGVILYFVNQFLGFVLIGISFIVSTFLHNTIDVNVILGLAVAFYLSLTVVAYFVINYFITNKLNLE